ncbi:MAG: class I SAM-dependent methyltransferase [Candidatus Eisenbacteria bacterium]|nr:class I SAM-dependent methyltransferase [Candidatus Eisenbacteria bacterium]
MSDPSRGELDRIRTLYAADFDMESRGPESPWHPLNPVSIYYRHAQERAIASVFHECGLDPRGLRALDVGCGSGGFLRHLVSLGARPEDLCGVDLLEARVRIARRVCPQGMQLHEGSADSLPCSDASFDLVSQFTVFSSVLEDGLLGRIAAEALRVLKPGGHLLWYDLRRGNGTTTRGFETHHVAALFPGCEARALRALHSPGAMRLAPKVPLLLDLLDRVQALPKTHYLAMLQKPG